jgi:hypothetical protein
MNTMYMFTWLFWQTVSAARYFSQVSILVLAVAVVCIAIGRRGLLRLSLRSWSVIAVCYAVPFLILVWGTLMHYEEATDAGPVWRTYIIGALLLCFVSLVLLSIWRFVGSRLVTFGLLLPPAWFSLCTAFIAGMSVTNDWI